jgi:hypothetical protein
LDGQVKDAPSVAPAERQAKGFSYTDVDMSPVLPVTLVADYVRPNSAALNDGIPRPPYDPLSTGQKVAGVFDVGLTLGGGYLAMSKFRENGLHVLRTDIRSLDRLVSSPELQEFRNLGGALKNKVGGLASAAQDDLIAMQATKPHLFVDLSTRGVWKGLNLKQPKYGLMNTAERAVVDRAADLGYISGTLKRGVNTSSAANFKSGLNMLTDLHKLPAARIEGLSPELRRLENLGLKVNEEVAESTISLAAESRALIFKNAGIIGAGIATNAIIEKTLLKNSAPSGLTMAADFASPFVVLTELPLWAKFSVIVGAHALTRLAESGTATGGSEKRSI